MDPNNIGGYGPQTIGMRGSQKGQECHKEGLGKKKGRESGAVESAVAVVKDERCFES